MITLTSSNSVNVCFLLMNDDILCILQNKFKIFLKKTIFTIKNDIITTFPPTQKNEILTPPFSTMKKHACKRRLLTTTK